MGLNVIGDWANLFFEFNLAGDAESMFTALGVRFTDATTTEDRATAAFNILNAAGPIWATELPQDYTTGPGHAEIGVSAGTNVIVDGTVTEVGLQVADATQQNTAWLVRKSTALGGRQGRGRMFVPGAVDVFVGVSGVLDPSYLDSLQTLIEDLQTMILAEPIVEALALFHSDVGSQEGTDILVLTVDEVVATQRRRLR